MIPKIDDTRTCTIVRTVLFFVLLLRRGPAKEEDSLSIKQGSCLLDSTPGKTLNSPALDIEISYSYHVSYHTREKNAFGGGFLFWSI